MWEVESLLIMPIVARILRLGCDSALRHLCQRQVSTVIGEQYPGIQPMSEIDEVKQRVDVVELIGRYVGAQTRGGTTYKGLCPFHNERTPSFVVFPQSGTWRCFGACGIGGDAFTFLMRRENLEFREALQQLAAEVGVTLEAEPDQNQHQRTRQYEINEVAAGYFMKILRHHQETTQARAYLEERGINAAMIDHFRLGFALDQSVCAARFQ